MATPETEIRKLQPIELCTLAQILNKSDAWKTLMAIIPKPGDQNQKLFNHDHFTMIEQAIRQRQQSGAEIFLSEWSTIGKRRPTCSTMLDLLVKAELFRAADYLAVDVLKGVAPERPKSGPAAPIDVSDKAFEELLKQQAVALEDDCHLSGEHSKLSQFWSMHYVEKPVNVTAAICQSDKVANQHKELSDLIKFSDTVKSDLIKFSDITIDEVENLPKEVSKVMIINDNSVAKQQTIVSDDYVLQEARTEDIPLCVRENAFQANETIASSNFQDTETSSTIDSINISKSSLTSDEINLPSISQNIIPVVVLEFNDKDKLQAK